MSTSDTKTIARYILGTAKSIENGRSWAQNELACYRALHPNTTPTIAYMTATAARVVGQAIAKRAKP